MRRLFAPLLLIVSMFLPHVASASYVIFDYQWTQNVQSREYEVSLQPPPKCLSRMETRRLVRKAAERMVQDLWDKGFVVSYSNPEGFVDDVLKDLEKHYFFCWE